MYSYLSKQFILFSAIITLGILFSSCVSNVDSENSSSIQLGFEIENIDSTRALEGDTIRVDNVRLIYADSFFDVQGEDSLLVNNQPIMLEFDPDQPQQFQNPLLLVGGGVPAGTYEGFFVDIPKAPRDDNNIDSGFTDENNRYSIIIRGEYEGESFTYKSDAEYTNTFRFNPLPIEDDGSRYAFIIRMDANSWFVDNTSGGLLNPGESESSEQINFNIQQSIEFEQVQ